MRSPCVLFPTWILVAAACSAPPAGAPLEAIVDTPLATEEMSLVAGLDGCDTEAEGCTYLSLRWPRVEAAPTPEGREALEQVISRALLGSAVSEERPESPEALAEEFFREYRDLVAEMPDMAMPWALERVIEIAWSNASLATVRVNEYSYTGGAHPNTIQTYSTLDLRTGHRLALADLFVGGHLPELEAAAEARFRAAHGISPEADLVDAGFWFDDDVFALTDNWGVVGEDLVFYFNPYDIAPYALGPTELKVPLGSLEPLIRADAALER